MDVHSIISSGDNSEEEQHAWALDETVLHQSKKIQKSLPPIAKVSRYLQCSRCADFVSLLLNSNSEQNVICLNSHSICNSCLMEVDECQFHYANGSLCKQAFVTLPQGNIWDFLRHESQFYCPYWNVGCKEIVVGRSLEFHLEKECAFRPLSSCVFTGCSTKRIVMSDLVNHIEYDHSVGVEVEKSFKALVEMDIEKCFKTEDKRSVLSLLECFNSHFIIVMHETSDKYFVWVLQCPFLDTTNKATRREYKAKVELFDRFAFISKSIRQLAEKWEPADLRKEWTFPVHSIYRPVEEIIHLAECFEISKKMLVDNFSYYMTQRKDKKTSYWRMEISVQEVQPYAGSQNGNMLPISNLIGTMKEAKN